MAATSSASPRVRHMLLLVFALALPEARALGVGAGRLRQHVGRASQVESAEPIVATTPRLNASTDQLLLYTYGKVGSSALQYSLARSMRMEGDLPFFPVKMYEYARGIDTHSPFVAEDFLDKVPEGGRVWVIAVTRNPFTHEVSNFFEQIDGIMQGARNVLMAGMPKLSEEFHKHFKRGIQMHNEWFATTLARVTQVDVRHKAHDFDFEKHRLVVEHDRNGRKLVLVVLRYEDIKEWDTILEPLIPNFRMMRANSARQKYSGKKYVEFLENYEWTADEVEQKLDSDSLPFYTVEERNSMLADLKVKKPPPRPAARAASAGHATTGPIRVPVTVTYLSNQVPR